MSNHRKCPQCGQPLLRAGEVRTNPDEYRHASGCPLDDYPRCKRPGCVGFMKDDGRENVCDEFRRRRYEEGDEPITGCEECCHEKECH